ncbi:hypothetical protein PR202_ga08307 [Eleusine coracana subsp. coracana]|uniref:SWIM-type domain-containing protein n=1 Tax=Eleusine coracana subsp. coracana TaxID=191504 RepID=A0AAV5BZU6_ELECO|nr:hypothetical protein PR202_ga08307 [Eleusine coracana subsp. coracana]
MPFGPGARRVPYIGSEIQQQNHVLDLSWCPRGKHTAGTHIEGIQRYCSSDAKVDNLASQYVQKLGMIIIKRSTHELDLDDQASIKMWVDRNKKSVFFYQDSTDADAFILGIQTDWQLQQMMRFGHQSLLASHSSFGVSKLKYPLHTLLVFDSRACLSPVAWIITRSVTKQEHIEMDVRALTDRIHSIDSTWKIGGFIIDDPASELDPIRYIIDMVVTSSNKISSVVEMWIDTIRNLALASQESCGAIEAYHLKLKAKAYDDLQLDALQRVDWLVHKLTTEVHSSYWLNLYADESGSFPEVKAEYIVSTSWQRALHIPDDAVLFDGKEPLSVKVASQKDASQMRTVWNAGSEFSLCDCSWSMQGNLCKHVIKERVQKAVELATSDGIAQVTGKLPIQWTNKRGRRAAAKRTSPIVLPHSNGSLQKDLTPKKSRKRKRLSTISS